MKKYILYLLAFLFMGLSVTGCSDDDDNSCGNSPIVGEWRMVSWSDTTVDGMNVYMHLTPCSTFELYQRVEHTYYTKYTGSYSAASGILSGVYSDGVAWATDYKYTLSEDGNTLTMVTVKEPVETSVYTRTIIPDDVKNSASTRAAADAKRVL